MGLTDKIRSTITHPFVAGPIGGGFIVLLAYLDSKYRDIEREQTTYLKLFMVSSLVFATITYFIYMEHTKPDEFLDQNYDTSVPSLVPESKGGFALNDQPVMERPSDYVSKMMAGLPEPGSYDVPGGNDPPVTMTMKPKYSSSSRSGRSHRSGRSGRSRHTRY